MQNDSLKQYIELYHSFKDKFNPDRRYASFRDRAEKTLLDTGKLPDNNAEGFKYFSVNEAFAPDYGINVNRLRQSPAPEEELRYVARFRCGVPNIKALLIYVYNDSVIIPDGTLRQLPEGVRISPLSDEPEGVGSLSQALNDATSALNTLLWQDGLNISIPRGVIVDRPVQIVNLLDARYPIASFRRIRINLAEGSQLKLLLCDHTEPGCAPSLTHQVIEATVNDNGRLEIYDLEETTQQTSRIWQMFASLKNNAVLHVNLTSLMCGKTRNELHVNLDGKGADYFVSGMAIATEQSVIDTNSKTYHHVSRGTSDQLFKYVIDDKAKAAFQGNVTVDPGAAKTEARQNVKNLMLSPDARVHSEPHLIILCDDVKCSHGATTGQLDAKALFYLRSRGIPLKEAENMLVRSFMTDVLDSISLEPLRERIQHLVEMKLSGEENARCLTCRGLNNEQ